MNVERETKHILGLSEVLKILAKEITEKGAFDKEDLELLRKVGSDILFKGVSLEYNEYDEKG